MELFQFEFLGTNESSHVYQGITVYSYTAYVATDAPAASPVIGSFTNTKKPDSIVSFSVVPWKAGWVLVQVCSLLRCVTGEPYAVTIMQKGASHYGPVAYDPKVD